MTSSIGGKFNKGYNKLIDSTRCQDRGERSAYIMNVHLFGENVILVFMPNEWEETHTFSTSNNNFVFT
jgi:hypothetical protein